MPEDFGVNAQWRSEGPGERHQTDFKLMLVSSPQTPN